MMLAEDDKSIKVTGDGETEKIEEPFRDRREIKERDIGLLR